MGPSQVLSLPLEWKGGGFGELSGLVVTSRVRLARNIARFPFSVALSPEEAEKLVNLVFEAASRSSLFKDAVRLRLDGMDEISRGVLFERHQISFDMMRASPQMPRGLILDGSGTISVMVNEEDHLRIQVLLGGFRLREALEIAFKVDEVFEGLGYAFDDEFGHLTSCPTNVGTGLRASVMLHLPAMQSSGVMDELLKHCNQLGLTVRGTYGEGSAVFGALYQLSNQVTLGRKEEEIAELVSRVTREVAEEEIARRDKTRRERGRAFLDYLWRAWGTLRYAQVITSKEALEKLSAVRVGSDMRILPEIPMNMWNELVLLTQPYHIQAMAGKELSPEERDVQRASFLRSKMELLS